MFSPNYCYQYRNKDFENLSLSKKFLSCVAAVTIVIGASAATSAAMDAYREHKTPPVASEYTLAQIEGMKQKLSDERDILRNDTDTKLINNGQFLKTPSFDRLVEKRCPELKQFRDASWEHANVSGKRRAGYAHLNQCFWNAVHLETDHHRTRYLELVGMEKGVRMNMK
jgi:hypothetical protein